jgi:predicted nucleic acid-binding protein
VVIEFAHKLTYLPLDTAVMRYAAALWAQAKQGGQMTADLKELNADVILAAQALQVGATVVTENVGHPSHFTRAVDWRTVEVGGF